MPCHQWSVLCPYEPTLYHLELHNLRHKEQQEDPEVFLYLCIWDLTHKCRWALHLFRKELGKDLGAPMGMDQALIRAHSR